MAKHDPDLTPLFHALADPTRRSILTRLAEGPAAVTELAAPTGLRLPTVMRHLSVLEEAGLIASSKDGRIRTCALVPEALTPVRTWLDDQRAIWEARLDRLDDYVTKLMKEKKIKIIISEAGQPERHVNRIARQTGAKVVELAGSVGMLPNTDDYISLFDANVHALVSAHSQQ